VPSAKLTIARADLVRATQAMKKLIDAIGLENYVFEVEPKEGSWQVKLECATSEGGWQVITLHSPIELLTNSLEDSESRRELTILWSKALSGCKRSA
jgi:hypothetical protein